MTVENLGACLDLPAPPQALVVHQPGWNCRLAQRFIALLPEAVPWWHFGDLDPEGLAIFAALVRAGEADRPLPGSCPHSGPYGAWAHRPRLFLPAWWGDYLPSHGLPLGADWPVGLTPDNALLTRLRAGRLWLEQEAILLDPRLGEGLARLGPAPTKS
jgi:hypothetical protein